MEGEKGGNKVVIDWSLVDKLLIAGCSGAEIADSIGIHKNTLYNRCRDDFQMNFDDYKTSKKNKGNSLLRAKQFEIAMNGDKSMLVWLGKNRLGQSDVQKFDHTTKGEKINVSINIAGDDLSSDDIE